MKERTIDFANGVYAFCKEYPSWCKDQLQGPAWRRSILERAVLPGDEIHRRGPRLAHRASQAGQHVPEQAIPMLERQQAHWHDRDAWRAEAAHFQAAARPIRQAMIEVEVWRVHRRSGMGAQTVDLHREHYKNIADVTR